MNSSRCFLFLMVMAGVTGAKAVPLDPPSSMRPGDLRCDFVTNPLAINTATPRLGRTLPSLEETHGQQAYHILVSSSLAKLHENNGDLWDSGRINSDQSQLITYGGTALLSRQHAYWKVRIWNQDNRASQWSKANNWRMGLTKDQDWQAHWIAISEDQNPDSPETSPAPYFRRDFEINKSIASATVYVSGLGYYELYINGDKVGDSVLSPAPTNYDKRNLRHLLYGYSDRSSTRILYNTFDVSAMLKPGANTIGMLLGNGWYNQRDRREEGWMWYDAPRLILQMEIEYRDGATESIVSDWGAPGKLVQSE